MEKVNFFLHKMGFQKPCFLLYYTCKNKRGITYGTI